MRSDSAIQAVVFDMDGVLVDSEELWDEIRRGLATANGLAWPADATAIQQGMSTPEWSAYLSEVVEIPGSPSQIGVEVIGRMAAAYQVELPMIPHAVETVSGLASRWRLGLASSSPRALIDTVLQRSGMVEDFELSLSTEEVSAGKPSPVVYESVVARLGVDPARTVAIEDSSNGLFSASAAGLIVIAVPHSAFPPAPDALALADVVVSAISDVTAELIESLR